MLVAPSLVPRKPGERIKTDRRDARKLAFVFRAGLLSEVQPLSEEDEAARDLSRAREDRREDLVRARHRLSTYLLRRGISFTPGKRAWTLAHRRWLESLRVDNPVETAVVEDYLLAIDQIEQRIKGLLVPSTEDHPSPVTHRTLRRRTRTGTIRRTRDAALRHGAHS